MEPVDDGHDEFCESDFILGAMAYSPCGCADRAAEDEDLRAYHAQQLGGLG